MVAILYASVHFFMLFCVFIDFLSLVGGGYVNYNQTHIVIIYTGI